jgi:hypothetical protein
MATESELSEGVYRHQEECVRFARHINYLLVTSAVDRFAAVLTEHGVVPVEKPDDAMGLANNYDILNIATNSIFTPKAFNSKAQGRDEVAHPVIRIQPYQPQRG